MLQEMDRINKISAQEQVHMVAQLDEPDFCSKFGPNVSDQLTMFTDDMYATIRNMNVVPAWHPGAPINRVTEEVEGIWLESIRTSGTWPHAAGRFTTHPNDQIHIAREVGVSAAENNASIAHIDSGDTRITVKYNSPKTHFAQEELLHAATFFTRGSAYNISQGQILMPKADARVHLDETHASIAIDSVLTAASIVNEEYPYWHTLAQQHTKEDALRVPEDFRQHTIYGTRLNERFGYPNITSIHAANRIVRLSMGNAPLTDQETKNLEFDHKWNLAMYAYGPITKELAQELIEIAQTSYKQHGTYNLDEIQANAIDWGKAVLQWHKTANTEKLLTRHHQPFENMYDARDLPLGQQLSPLAAWGIEPYLRHGLPPVLSSNRIMRDGFASEFRDIWSYDPENNARLYFLASVSSK